MKIFNCRNVRHVKGNVISLSVEGINILYDVAFSLSVVQEYTLRGINYASLCKILFDVRKLKVIEIECTGFNAFKVEKALKDCFKEQKIAVVDSWV